MLIGNVHLIAGTADDIPALKAFLGKEGIETRSNPDVYVRTYESFGVDEARELRERAYLGAVGDGPRIFIISAPGMTSEAQNAFLKTLEEPPANAMFFIIVPSPETLLPTLRSRAQSLLLPLKKMGDTTVSVSEVDANAFLKALPQKRLDMLKPLLEKNDDDKRDTSAILLFLSSLERAMFKSHSRDGIRAVYLARKYIMDKGALVKPLLEQVALLTPRI